MIKWLRAEVLTRMLFDSKDMHNIFNVSSDERVVNLIKLYFNNSFHGSGGKPKKP